MHTSTRLRAAATLVVGLAAMGSALLTIGGSTAAHAVGSLSTQTIPCHPPTSSDDAAVVETPCTTTTRAPVEPPYVCVGAGCNAAPTVTTVAPVVITEPPTTAGGGVLAAASTAPTGPVLAATGAAIGRGVLVGVMLVLFGFGVLRGMRRIRGRHFKP